MIPNSNMFKFCTKVLPAFRLNSDVRISWCRRTPDIKNASAKAPCVFISGQLHSRAALSACVTVVGMKYLVYSFHVSQQNYDVPVPARWRLAGTSLRSRRFNNDRPTLLLNPSLGGCWGRAPVIPALTCLARLAPMSFDMVIRTQHRLLFSLIVVPMSASGQTFVFR